MNFNGQILFTWSQIAYDAFILDYLYIMNTQTDPLRQINRYIKKRNIESKVTSHPELYAHGEIKQTDKNYLYGEKSFYLVDVTGCDEFILI